MKKYEKLEIKLIVGQMNDVLTASGEYEGFSNINSWFSSFDEGGENS